MRFKLAHMWRDPEAKEVQEHQLSHAEVELLEAEENAEHWTSRRDMLKLRVARLRGPQTGSGSVTALRSNG